MRRIWIIMCVLVGMAWQVADTSAQTQDIFTAAWQADYFNNPYLAGEPVFTRDEDRIGVDWGDNIPTVNTPADNFSVRWTKEGTMPAGTYRFIVTASVGFRLYVDGVLIIDAWDGEAAHIPTGYDYAIDAGYHSIQVDYYALDGASYIYLDWGIAPDGEVPPQPLAEATENSVSVSVNILNVRSAPRIANNITAQIYLGQRFVALSTSDDGRWILLDLGNGTTGWVSAAFVARDSP